MITDDSSCYFHNSAGASKKCMVRERSIKVWNVETIKYFKRGLSFQDLSSDIETRCLAAISAFCYK